MSWRVTADPQLGDAPGLFAGRFDRRAADAGEGQPHDEPDHEDADDGERADLQRPEGDRGQQGQRRGGHVGGDVGTDQASTTRARPLAAQIPMRRPESAMAEAMVSTATRDTVTLYLVMNTSMGFTVTRRVPRTPSTVPVTAPAKARHRHLLDRRTPQRGGPVDRCHQLVEDGRRLEGERSAAAPGAQAEAHGDGEGEAEPGGPVGGQLGLTGGVERGAGNQPDATTMKMATPRAVTYTL